MVIEYEKEERDKTQLGSMRLLNSVTKEETHGKKGGGLMFVKVSANNKVTKTLVDMGVSHNLLSKNEAGKMNI